MRARRHAEIQTGFCYCYATTLSTHPFLAIAGLRDVVWVRVDQDLALQCSQRMQFCSVVTQLSDLYGRESNGRELN
jgi:hypothetical protein